MSDVCQSSTQIAIVGAGMSGIACAIQLKRAGFDRFILLEKSSQSGGTWLENSYPQAGCDVPSHLYSFSFAPKLDWTEKYARQPEILDYFQECVRRFQLPQHIQFTSEVRSATYDEADCCWLISLTDGRLMRSGILISAVGQLNRPHVPAIQGLDSFRGSSWHSACWNHEFDLSGRRIAVIGNGASTVQFLPAVARQARAVDLFQRSPNYILPLHNYRYSRLALRLFRSCPGLAKLHRLGIFLSAETRTLIFKRDRWLNREVGRWIRSRMKRQIASYHRHRLLPTYAAGCKRILRSNDYLETLARQNVELITDPITKIEPRAVRTSHNAYTVDAIIFGTGFKSHSWQQAMQLRGRHSKTLDEAWSDRPRSLLGLATPGFPNLFFLYGPNTNLGHNSIIYMVETQVRYIVQCLKYMRRTGMDEIEVTEAAVERFDKRLQQRLRNTVWSTGCTSWYKNASGAIPNNWYGSALAYRMLSWRPRFRDYRFRPATGDGVFSISHQLS